MSIISINKKAKFDYSILETFQAGLSLSGGMVKLIRSRKVQALGLYVVWQNQQLQIIHLGNESYRENATILLKKREIEKIKSQIKIKGIGCIVLNIKTVGRWVKAEIAIVKGKNKSDKRDTLKQKAINRDMQRDEVMK